MTQIEALKELISRYEKLLIILERGSTHEEYYWSFLKSKYILDKGHCIVCETNLGNNCKSCILYDSTICMYHNSYIKHGIYSNCNIINKIKIRIKYLNELLNKHNKR